MSQSGEDSTNAGADAGAASLPPEQQERIKLKAEIKAEIKEELKTEGKEGEEKREEGKDKEKGEDDKNKSKKPVYQKPVFIITAIIVGIVLIVGVIILWLILRQYVRTDDAYVDGHVVQISPQVAAAVVALHVDDNQFKRKGDLLVELDPTNYQVALFQAQAQVTEARDRLEQARTQIETAKANVPETVAQQHSAESTMINARHDFERYKNVDPRARSRQQLENAGTTFTNAQARLEQADAQVVSAMANITNAVAAAKAAEGAVATAEASEQRAEVDLGYCKIYAPCDGRVTERTVEVGNYATTGQALFLLVDPNVWVTANFKETQLTHMAPGQEVTIDIDAFPKHKFHGHVDSIQAGSGSRFSVLPAENATGNFVKIVQRVPVKILFDHDANTNDTQLLSPGLSVTPRVKVR